MAIFSAIAAAVSGIASAIGAGVSAIGGAIGSAVGGLGGLGGLSAAAGLIGTGISAYGAMQQAKGQKKAEALRLRQSNLEAARARRNTVRQAIIARSQALASATAQGAEGGSGIQGGMGQVAGQAGSNIQGINQGQSIGFQMFQANSQIASGQTLASIGSGVQSLGNFFAQNQQPLGRLFPTS